MVASSPSTGLAGVAGDAGKARAEVRASRYLVSPVYDWCFFLGAPVLALLAGLALARVDTATRPILFHGGISTPATLLVGVLVHAHLLAVVFRSHGNPAILARHRLRFLVVPPLLYVLLLSSSWLLVAASVLATFWDVYHSGLQTFGFARIYDAKAGNPPQAGRRWDWWLNQLLYAGPILAGATLMDHVGDFADFEQVGSALLASVPARVEGWARPLTWALVGGGGAFLAAYVAAWVRLHRRGHVVSAQKVFLLVSTGLVSIYAWGFNGFGMAFVIMNLFHAVQYLALVAWSERAHLPRIFSVQHLRGGGALAVLLFLVAVVSYGYCVQAMSDATPLLAVTLVVSLMHFWYDGFIWSVRRGEVGR